MAQQVYVSGFWRRSLALLCDAVILGGVIILYLAVSLWLLGPVDRPLTGELKLLSFLPELALVVGLSLAYTFFFHALCGQTPGKMLLRIKVIRRDGSLPGSLTSLLRSLSYLLSLAVFGGGFLWAAFHPRRVALHDWLAGTYVILAR